MTVDELTLIIGRPAGCCIGNDYATQEVIRSPPMSSGPTRFTVREREERGVEQLCKVLARIEQHQVKAVEWPDRNGEQGGCDAIIERGGVHHAVEHTTVDSFDHQREDSDRFTKVVVPLENALATEFDSWFITISVPTGTIPTGVDWNALRDNLIKHCRSAINQMHKDEYREFTFEGIPFPVHINKQGGEWGGGVFVSHHAPSNVAEQLKADMARAIRDKREKLGRYKAKGVPTILLIDSDDIALVNDHTLATSFASAAANESTESIDEVFLVEADRNPPWVYPLKLEGKLYPNLPKYDQFRQIQFQMTYAERAQSGNDS